MMTDPENMQPGQSIKERNHHVAFNCNEGERYCERDSDCYSCLKKEQKWNSTPENQPAALAKFSESYYHKTYTAEAKQMPRPPFRISAKKLRQSFRNRDTVKISAEFRKRRKK